MSAHLWGDDGGSRMVHLCCALFPPGRPAVIASARGARSGTFPRVSRGMSFSCLDCGDNFYGLRKDHIKSCIGQLQYSLLNRNGIQQVFTVPLAVLGPSDIVCACLCSVCVASQKGWSAKSNKSVLKQHMTRKNSYWMGADLELVSAARPCFLDRLELIVLP